MPDLSMASLGKYRLNGKIGIFLDRASLCDFLKLIWRFEMSVYYYYYYFFTLGVAKVGFSEEGNSANSVEQ